MKKWKGQEMPSYLVNMVNAIMELHQATEELKSKSVIVLKTGKGTKKTEVISGKWLLKKTGTYLRCQRIRILCVKVSGKIRYRIGYYHLASE